MTTSRKTVRYSMLVNLPKDAKKSEKTNTNIIGAIIADTIEYFPRGIENPMERMKAERKWIADTAHHIAIRYKVRCDSSNTKESEKEEYESPEEEKEEKEEKGEKKKKRSKSIEIPEFKLKSKAKY